MIRFMNVSGCVEDKRRRAKVFKGSTEGTRRANCRSQGALGRQPSPYGGDDGAKNSELAGIDGIGME